jgi:hypothetical protein
MADPTKKYEITKGQFVRREGPDRKFVHYIAKTPTATVQLTDKEAAAFGRSRLREISGGGIAKPAVPVIAKPTAAETAALAKAGKARK